MPLAAMCFGDPSSGKSEVYVTELITGVDYVKLRHFITMYISNSKTPTLSITEDHLRQVLSLAQNDRERELIKYTAFRASGLTQTSATRCLGIHNMSERSNKIEQIILETKRICEVVDELSIVLSFALLVSVQLTVIADSDSDTDLPVAPEVADNQFSITSLPSNDTLLEILRPEFNWFHLVDEIISHSSPDTEEKKVIEQLEPFHVMCMESGCISEKEKMMLKLSYEAFNNDWMVSRPQARHEADALNGMIVCDAEAADPDDYLGITDVTSSEVRNLIRAKQKSVLRRNRYMKHKVIAEQNFFKRHVNKRSKGIVDCFPDIGKTIEAYVEECNVGADSWQRTGVLTFDGNTKVKSKVPFEKIRQHLIQTYDRNFSYGTVVQLCVARNCRRHSAARYKGVAKVTSRRARKGFMMKFNPDAHWSSAMYRILNHLQYQDGTSIVNLNRDDAAGYRLDTMATHRLPMVKDAEATTTYTDYVNKYTLILQTTSYHFSKTGMTGQLSAGVVKATGVYPKNPAQHMADLKLLENVYSIQPAFMNPITDKVKQVECIRVDGASDEGPSHEEVQFLWTERHFERASYATLVTSRNSGSSYLN